MRLPLSDELRQAFAAKDARAIAALYGDDAMLLLPGREPVRGRAAIERVMGEDAKDPGFSLDLVNELTDASGSGEMAYTRGSFRAAFTHPLTRQVQTVAGTFLQILRKDTEGRWVIIEDISCPGVTSPLDPTPGES
jgi:uncharacterized protein (TIGR02246 family)